MRTDVRGTQTAANLMEAFVSTAPTVCQRLYASAALAAVVLAYGGLIPFSARQMARIPAFLPACEGMTGMADFLAAVFLYSQFSITRSRALLVLASGYVFAAFVVVLRICMFPGVFASNGLLGAGPQSAAWLY